LRSWLLWQVLATTFVQSFQAPSLVAPAAPARANMQMALEQLPGAGPETGGKAWDPMGISDMCPYGSTQYEWMRTAEIKHGRVCMAASVGFLVQESGLHFSGYLSKTPEISFESLSGMGALAAWAAVPALGKAQIMTAAGLIEAFAEAQKPHYMKAGMPQFEGKGAKGRISELKNGRLAMIAVASFYAGCQIQGSVPLLPGSWH